MLAGLLRLVQRDTTLCLAIRDGYVNVYFRGGSLLKLTENGAGFEAYFDANYLDASLPPPTLPSRWTTSADTALFLEQVPALKHHMDLWFGTQPKYEREVQQLVLRHNNWGKVAQSTDYFVCDLEYAEKGHRFDLIAARWRSQSQDRKRGDRARLAVIEIKHGDAALSGSAGLSKHVRDVDNALSAPSYLASLKQEMIEVFQQLHALELIETTHTLTAFTDEKPELILLCSDHDPASSVLERELRLLPMPRNVELRVATASFMGYGLYEEGLVDLGNLRALQPRLFAARPEGSEAGPVEAEDPESNGQAYGPSLSDKRPAVARPLDFKGRERQAQMAWRTQHLPEDLEHGTWRGRRYPHIVPADQWELLLWPGIRADQPHSVAQHIERGDIEPHDARSNLLSSWVLCANLFFPFGHESESRRLLAAFLRARLGVAVLDVDRIELEFADESPRDPSTLLGEKGKRGAHQTSPDVAFVVAIEGMVEPGLVLTEVKYTEHDFYACSAHVEGDESAFVDDDCGDLAGVLQDPASRCALHSTKSRRYFDWLAEPMARADAVNVGLCPAARYAYQLFRQQALAEALATAPGTPYGYVASCVAYHADNRGLIERVAGPGGDLNQVWKARFLGKAAFHAFTHQDWVGWVREQATSSGWIPDWLRWVEARYRL